MENSYFGVILNQGCVMLISVMNWESVLVEMRCIVIEEYLWVHIYCSSFIDLSNKAITPFLSSPAHSLLNPPVFCLTLTIAATNDRKCHSLLANSVHSDKMQHVFFGKILSKPKVYGFYGFCSQNKRIHLKLIPVSPNYTVDFIISIAKSQFRNKKTPSNKVSLHDQYAKFQSQINKMKSWKLSRSLV